MIPDFNKDGYLPKGIYKAGINEIKEKFGKNSARRKELFKGILSVVKLLHKHRNSIIRFILDGSYVTSNKEPKDFDCILIVKNDFDFNSPEAVKLQAAKRLFGAHLFTFTEDDDVCYRSAS